MIIQNYSKSQKLLSSIKCIISHKKDRHKMCDHPKILKKNSKCQNWPTKSYQVSEVLFSTKKTATKCVIIQKSQKFSKSQKLLSITRVIISHKKDRHKMCDHPKILKKFLSVRTGHPKATKYQSYYFPQKRPPQNV